MTYPAIFPPPESPGLDPAVDLFLSDVDLAVDIRVADDALPVGEGNAGVVIFYELTEPSSEVMKVTKDGPDIILSML